MFADGFPLIFRSLDMFSMNSAGAEVAHGSTCCWSDAELIRAMSTPINSPSREMMTPMMRTAIQSLLSSVCVPTERLRWRRAVCVEDRRVVRVRVRDVDELVCFRWVF